MEIVFNILYYIFIIMIITNILSIFLAIASIIDWFTREKIDCNHPDFMRQAWGDDPFDNMRY